MKWPKRLALGALANRLLDRGLIRGLAIAIGGGAGRGLARTPRRCGTPGNCGDLGVLISVPICWIPRGTGTGESYE